MMKPLNSNLTFIIIALLYIVGASASTESSALLIKSVMIIDGSGKPPYGPVDVEIKGERIFRIGPKLQSKAQKEIDGTGKTLIPGLIDAHTHIRSVPGAIFRNEGSTEIQAQQKKQLKAYLAAGVTTVLDAATPNALYTEISQLEKTTILPRFFGLSPFLTPKDGYFASAEARRSFYNDLSKPIENLADIRERINDSVHVRSVGIKVTVEFGFSPFAAYPVFDAPFIEKIRDEAQIAKRAIFAHSESEKSFEIALGLNPYAFMHGGFFDAPASPMIIRKIKQSNAYVVSTLAIYKMMLLMWEQELFEDPWFKTLVPENQITTAKKVTTEVVKYLAVQNKPRFVPRMIAELLSGFFINSKNIKQYYQNSKASITAMHVAGIPIVMGSDAGNYPLFSTFFHGVGSILEIEALIDAGLPVVEAIQASTTRAAKLLKIAEDVGQISEGKLADLVLLNQDPFVFQNAFRKVDYVIKGGIAKRPGEWMQD